MRTAIAFAFVLVSACESSMRDPPPIESLAPRTQTAQSPEAAMQAAEHAWMRRGEPGAAAIAQDAYLAAGASGDRRVDALIGAMTAIHYRVEYEPGAAKGELTRAAVQAGQWCLRLSPRDPACEYRLAIALGQEAREHPLEARDALGHMIELLRDVIARDPTLDSAGPHRVLALVLVRAPSWPGPGDADAALDEARAAVAATPELAENQLALAEALAANGATSEAHQAYRHAATLAAAELEPEAIQWRSEAREGLRATE